MTRNKHIQCIYYFVLTMCQCQIYMYFMFCSWILVQLLYKSLMYFEIKKSWTFQLLRRQLSLFCSDVICFCADVIFFTTVIDRNIMFENYCQKRLNAINVLTVIETEWGIMSHTVLIGNINMDLNFKHYMYYQIWHFYLHSIFEGSLIPTCKPPDIIWKLWK